MGDNTKIQWTDTTWNPTRGCTMVSDGCSNCYAMKDAHRFNGEGQPYEGLTRVTGGRPVWNGNITLVPHNLDQPIRWTRPRRIFVNSMSDVFHESVPFEFVAAIFGAMAAAPQHQFQVLTKRPQRMLEFFEWLDITRSGTHQTRSEECRYHAMTHSKHKSLMGYDDRWPLPNVWLGVSVEDQKATSRVASLIQAPAAVRFISAEPLIGPVEFDGTELAQIDWIIAGGESGNNARVCKQSWIESLLAQSRATETLFFFKQKGSLWAKECGTVSRKGGDIQDFPQHLQVREFPAAAL